MLLPSYLLLRGEDDLDQEKKTQRNQQDSTTYQLYQKILFCFLMMVFSCEKQ